MVFKNIYFKIYSLQSLLKEDLEDDGWTVMKQDYSCSVSVEGIFLLARAQIHWITLLHLLKGTDLLIETACHIYSRQWASKGFCSALNQRSYTNWNETSMLGGIMILCLELCDLLNSIWKQLQEEPANLRSGWQVSWSLLLVDGMNKPPSFRIGIATEQSPPKFSKNSS